MLYIRMLSELNHADLNLAGGKGANLGAMVQSGLPVPPGFCITTAGYRRFIESNQLQESILARLAHIRADQPDELELASADIRQMFYSGRLPDDIAAEVRGAYGCLARSQANDIFPVAVRSSATAEDLPDLSFAGQQDTYLNIIGEGELLDAVLRCWASLWTARAIGYRARSHISQAEVALAVVVQRMVSSEVSGVLFTANPLTGKRSETVIDATFGLGEALVSGMVEPDHYVVDAAQGLVLKKTLGAKALSVRGVADGGTQVVSESSAHLQALPDPYILELARLGQRAEQFFGGPQDMEWAWADGQLHILQSRPVTSLYPLPEALPAEPLQVLFSFSHWQGLLEPISPLGQDTFTGLVTGLGRYFGSQANIRSQRVMQSAGERLFVNITGLLRSTPGRKIVGQFIPAVDPPSAAVIQRILEEQRLGPDSPPMRPRRLFQILRGLAPIARSVFYNLRQPVRGRERVERKTIEVLESTRARCQQAADLAALVSVVEDASLSNPGIMLPYLLPAVIAGQVPLQLLLRLAGSLPNGNQRVMDLTRGLPHNVTTEMDLKLWSAAQAIRADVPSAGYFCEQEAGVLCKEYLAGSLPPVAQEAVARFMEQYGMRSVGEIDLARPRWREDPLHIFQVLKSYLEIGSLASAPDVLFQQSAERSAQALEELVAALRKTRFGGFKARLARVLAFRIRELTGLRETPKFAIIRLLGEIRMALLEAGRRLVSQGILESAEDIFFLHIWELKDLALGRLDALDLIHHRRQTQAREQKRLRIPRLLLSDGTTYYEGLTAPAGPGQLVLLGSGVSAGVVEGRVHVICDPHSTRLEPGEILVCPATDPAWTPLFLAAGGLVMEVGGMMTHGSVVAREYGIPAVAGVSQATTRLQTGQRVRVDGSAGQVVILE